MKTLLVIPFSILLCSHGVMAQNTVTKINQQINAFNTKLVFDNFQSFSSEGEKYERQHPNIQKTPKDNQFKSIPEEGHQKLDSIIYESWDYSAKQFFIDWKTVYVYDAKGNMIWDIYFNWNDSTNQWVDVSKYEFIYDVNRSMTSKIYYSFKETTKQWADVSKYEYTYDANGNKILQFLYLMDENTLEWDLYSKDEYTYDVNGNNILHIEYFLNGNQWVMGMKDEYTYDARGNMTLNINYYWDKYRSKRECSYNLNGNMILAINYSWNETQSKWNARDSVVYTYDVNGNNTMTIKYIWDWDNSQWRIFCRTEFTYDSYGDMTSSISDFGDEPLPPYVLGWNTKTNYYYSEHNITFIPETPEKQISVYPNPATDFIVFDLTNMSETAIVELFDVEGKMVFEQKLSENTQISVSNLPKGLYMYKLNNSGIICTGKLVVE